MLLAVASCGVGSLRHDNGPSRILVMVLVMILVMFLAPLAGPEHDDGLSVLGSRSFPAALPAAQGGRPLALSVLTVP